MSIEVKVASRDDIHRVYETMVAAFGEYRDKLHPPSGALSETMEDIENTMNQGGGSVIAWNDNIAVGSARYKYRDHYMYIGRVSVIPEYRGQGIGKSLLNFLEEKARAEHIAEARVEVRLSIPENIEMYKRLKYEVIEQLYYPERTDSWYVMAKHVRINT